MGEVVRKSSRVNEDAPVPKMAIKHVTKTKAPIKTTSKNREKEIDFLSKQFNFVLKL